MRRKQDLEALIETTMAFAKDVKREPKREPIPDLPIVLKTAEQASAETPKPIEPPSTITPQHDGGRPARIQWPSTHAWCRFLANVPSANL